MTNEQLQFCLELIKKQLENEVDKIDDELGDAVERNIQFKYIGESPLGGLTIYHKNDDKKRESKLFKETKTTALVLDDLRKFIDGLDFC